MSALRVLIVDDEAVARRRLRRLLGELDEVVVAGECADGVEALARLKKGGVDVLLLDVQMPRLTGIEALQLIDPGGPAVIFTTAHAEHAVAAFAGEAVDYVLKPVEGERLGLALERARRRNGSDARSRPAPDLPARLPVPTRHGLVLLHPEQISCAVLDGESCLVCTATESYVSDFRLADLESRLPTTLFERVHRRALVNLEQIERLEPNEVGGYEAHLVGGRVVEVSRQAARKLRKKWDLPR